MAYIFVTSPCFGCHQPFSYNPNTVPSIRHDGQRMPICLTCIERVNPQRAVNGLPPIVPLPGAYEPVDENEVIWSDG
jgi:hypothetical protein